MDNLSPNLDNSEVMYLLGHALARLRGADIIIGLDWNACSTMWGSTNTNDEGEAIEDFMAQHSLKLLNQITNIYTYQSNRGSSNIDITLARGQITRRVQNWRVEDGWTLSDHRVIVFNINSKMSQTDQVLYNKPRYKTRLRNYEVFNNNLRRGLAVMPLPLTTEGEINECVSVLETSIQKTADETLKKPKIIARSVPWWSAALTGLRKATHAARRDFQRSSGEDREPKRLIYLGKKRKYVQSVRRAKRDSWRKFVDRESSKNPWGAIHKLCTSKLSPVQVATAICTNNLRPISWDESIEILLNELIVPDDPAHDTCEQQLLRYSNAEPEAGDDPPFTEEEISGQLCSLRRGRAPGLDGINVDMVRGSWPCISDAYTSIINACLKLGVFPKRWKHGKIIALLKGGDRDAADPSSYRSICLLPVFGKLLEKLIKERLETYTTNMFKYQYGFTKGRSTVDAITKLKTLVNETNDKYVFGIFAHIKGAFDRVWWPDILKSLRDIRCPLGLYKLVKNYPLDRRVTVIQEANQITKEQNRGCPQGSVLGPTFWNLVFESLLERLSLICNPIAYADDLVILTSGNSRKQVEETAQRAVLVLEEWCNNHKMVISVNKTSGILLKGRLDGERPPRVRLSNECLKVKDTLKYLGVIIDRGLSFRSHPKYVAEKAKKIMTKYAALYGLKWGVSYREMSVVYKGSFVPIITYAVYVWMDNVNVINMRKIITAHRYALLRVTKAYRTISTDALEVVANIPPIEFALYEEKLRYCMRKSLPCVIYGKNYYTENQDPQSMLANLRADNQTNWNNKWQNSIKGRVTFDFFPSLNERFEKTWIVTFYYLTQALTGHGNFNRYLADRGISDPKDCTCGAEDTVWHVLYQCDNYTAHRQAFVNKVNIKGYNWPIQANQLMCEDIYGDFVDFVIKIMIQKEQQSDTVQNT